MEFLPAVVAVLVLALVVRRVVRSKRRKARRTQGENTHVYGGGGGNSRTHVK